MAFFGLSELGIPKRRKSSSKQATRLLVTTETVQGMAQKLSDSGAWISLQKKKQRN
jgi:hypothetical protein